MNIIKWPTKDCFVIVFLLDRNRKNLPPNPDSTAKLTTGQGGGLQVFCQSYQLKRYVSFLPQRE